MLSSHFVHQYFSLLAGYIWFYQNFPPGLLFLPIIHLFSWAHPLLVNRHDAIFIFLGCLFKVSIILYHCIFSDHFVESLPNISPQSLLTTLRIPMFITPNTPLWHLLNVSIQATLLLNKGTKLGVAFMDGHLVQFLIQMVSITHIHFY